ncbi:Tudor staphylococcal nuclease [Carabus blaptoides fortunei]
MESPAFTAALEDMFALCGEIKKIFVHKNRSYGMVEYFDMRSCNTAINELHNKPPLKLFVNMARNQPCDKKNSPTIMTTPPRRSENSFDSSSSKSNSGAMFYDEEIIYLDNNNKQVDILEDENGVIYVPLSRVTGIKRVVRKKPKLGDEVINLDNGEFGVLLDQRSKQDNDTMSQSSNRSDRVVKVKDKANITIERSFNDDQSHRRSLSRNSFDQQASRNRSKSRSSTNPDQNQYYKHSNNTSTPHQNRKFPNQYRQSGPTHNSYNDRQSNNGEQTPRPRYQADFKHTYQTNKENTNANNNDEKMIETNGNSVSSPKQEEQKIQNNVQPPRKIPINLKNMSLIKKSSFKSIELPKEQFTTVKVIHTISETVGWVHIAANEESFVNNVMTKLQEASCTASVQDPEINVMCMAKYDGIWYRARVLAITPKVRVKFVDYGNECDDPTGGLLKLESPFLRDMPAQTVCIRLADGAPCKMDNELELKVKPLQVENDILLVQVENSLCDKDEIDQENPVHSSTPIAEPSTSENSGMFNIIQRQLYSKIKEGILGIMERATIQSGNSFIASFLPHNLSDELYELSMAKPIPDDSFKADVGDVVSAENEDGWNRALILDIEQNQYKVAFIDYGTMSVVKEIRPVPEHIKTAPQFACKCMVPDEYSEAVSKADNFNYVIVSISGLDIRIKLSSNGKFLCETTVQAWNPVEPKRDDKLKTTTPSRSIPAPASTVNNRVLSELKLNNDDYVQLVCENNGIVFIRTKQANDVLKRVNKKVNEFAPKAPSLSEKPIVGQLVAAKFGDEWYRASVKSVEHETALIVYVDYGNDEKVNISGLKVLPEELHSEPITLIKIKLKNFINKPFSPNALRYLEQLAIKQVILKANFINSVESGVTLTMRDGSCITDKLMELSKDLSNAKPKIPPIVKTVKNGATEAEDAMPKPPGPNDPKITEMDIQELPKGRTQIKLLNQLDGNMVTICLNKADVFHALHVELGARITKYGKTIAPQEPYAPEPEEYVIANNLGKWYRALCLGVEGDEYNLFFADYGFMSMVPSNRIRRIPVEFAKPEAIANFACIQDLPEPLSQAVIDRLQTLLEPNDVYNVEVLERDEDIGAYIISMPTVIKTLQNEGLI